MIAARCPLCCHETVLPSHWFTRPLWVAQADRLVTIETKEAYCYHRQSDGKPCPSNGVRKL